MIYFVTIIKNIDIDVYGTVSGCVPLRKAVYYSEFGCIPNLIIITITHCAVLVDNRVVYKSETTYVCIYNITLL